MEHLSDEHGISLAYSDPCFELWLVLHLQDHDSTVDHHQVQKIYGKLDASYQVGSSKVADCSLLLDRISESERRAAALIVRREAEGNARRRPSTTVHVLTKKLRGEPDE
jgi:hypothetical protein